MSKKAIRLIVIGMMTALLTFSQVVLAGYECQRLNSAVSTLTDHCMSDKTAPSVTCTAHCDQSAQITGSAANIPTPSFSLLAWLHPLPTLMTLTTTDTVIYAATAPPLIFPTTPLRLQYQVFRI